MKCIAENLLELANVIIKYQSLIVAYYDEKNVPREEIKGIDFQTEFLELITQRL
jgi:hypothetical protein